ncbi:MAG: SPFH domain-containing protein [Lachnospiraceae bacterium]|nr:SPFH domain-containing protein [Lachnospiraceae bacterium]
MGLNIIKVIQFEGPDHVLVWKHPAEDFNTLSQLIVHESQEAVLLKDGRAADLFGPGRYTLETENIPLLRQIIGIPLNGKSPFHCEVYFINKAEILNVLWGTSQPLLIQDPVYHIILPVRANGQFGLRVVDGRKLLVKLVGTTADMTKTKAAELFKGMLMTKVKNLIADLITEKQISFVDIHRYLDEISERILEHMAPMYAEYGMEVVNFFVNSISVPENDPGYCRIRTALAAAKEKELLAKGAKAEMEILGYSYQEKRTYDVLEKAAQNEGGGAELVGAGIGMGLGVHVGSAVGNAMQDAMQSISGMSGNIAPDMARSGAPCAAEKIAAEGGASGAAGNRAARADGIFCPACGTKLPDNAKFCFECGVKIARSCPDCGAQLQPGAKFCLECGKKLQ